MLQRDEETIAYLADHASRGPRYTSYPPATEFGAIAQDRVRRELQELGSGQDPVSLYVHIPFCRSLCAYCGCNVVPTRNTERGVAYVDQLTTEMALVGRTFTAPISEIALGGGSPNFLEPKILRRLVAAIECYFPIARDARRSIELDPRSTTSSQIEALADARFNSLSMGVQDFSPGVQNAIRRHQSVAQTRWLVDRARSAGLDDINIDIVYGLPLQTETTFDETLAAVIALAPDRVALFGYAHLPDRLPHQRLVERAGRVLDRYERASLLLLAIERFAAAGYVHLGLDHFARAGSRLAEAATQRRMSRTFQGYVEHRADSIIGLGASAISSTPHLHWQNHVDLASWETAIAAGRLPVERGFVLDEDDRARRDVIAKLMCDGEAELGAIASRHGLDVDTYFARELSQLATLGDLGSYDRETRTVHTTPIGRLLVRNVCMLFDRYSRPNASGFSSTI
jgi:oxygen-independent coproporphyrinogen III oxidase